ncbi:MAG: bifunctional precorrin-2 dehydrogenase/sirohydrochlorin ferrochelatase, partial [Candidatus Sumerlaeota bacterium]|nr:bifunctional precorrin-2 dehydrogenase/sirohydrochlorin ferrochelatase [Candidatus Sumerlaeota bacterium]
MPRNLYPICLDLSNRLAVIVGGGEVAERKARGLLECRAEVRVVAPEATDALKAMAQRREIEWLRREFHPGDVEKAFFVFAATDSPAVNTRVCQACDLAAVLVNRVESPEASDFIVPVTLRRGGFTISIATAGASPHLGQVVRERLAGQFGPEYETYVDVL